jgi:hypothetical protein
MEVFQTWPHECASRVLGWSCGSPGIKALHACRLNAQNHISAPICAKWVRFAVLPSNKARISTHSVKALHKTCCMTVFRRTIFHGKTFNAEGD